MAWASRVLKKKVLVRWGAKFVPNFDKESARTGGGEIRPEFWKKRPEICKTKVLVRGVKFVPSFEKNVPRFAKKSARTGGGKIRPEICKEKVLVRGAVNSSRCLKKTSWDFNNQLNTTNYLMDFRMCWNKKKLYIKAGDSRNFDKNENNGKYSKN